MKFNLIDKGLSPLINRPIPQDVINTLFESIQINGVYNNGAFSITSKELSDDNTINVEINIVDKVSCEHLLDKPDTFKMCYKVKSIKESVDGDNLEKPIVLIEDLFFLPKHISF